MQALYRFRKRSYHLNIEYTDIDRISLVVQLVLHVTEIP